MIDAFLAWLDGLTHKTGDSIIKAINYTNGCLPYLKNYLKDGANASMVIYSLIETAKANDIDPEKYLEYLLEKHALYKME